MITLRNFALDYGFPRSACYQQVFLSIRIGNSSMKFETLIERATNVPHRSFCAFCSDFVIPKIRLRSLVSANRESWACCSDNFRNLDRFSPPPKKSCTRTFIVSFFWLVLRTITHPCRGAGHGRTRFGQIQAWCSSPARGSGVRKTCGFHWFLIPKFLPIANQLLLGWAILKFQDNFLWYNLMWFKKVSIFPFDLLEPTTSWFSSIEFSRFPLLFLPRSLHISQKKFSPYDDWLVWMLQWNSYLAVCTSGIFAVVIC